MSVKFVVLGSQRSGTVLLEEMISSHRMAHCWGEVLLGMDGPSRVSFPGPLARHRRARHAWQHVMCGAALRPGRVIQRTLAEPDVLAVGFRVMYNQLRGREIAALRSSDVRVIHVERRNSLRQYVSLMQMRARQRSHGYGSAHSRTNTVFASTHIDPTAALSFLQKREWEKEHFANVFASRIALTVSYEQDILTIGDAAREQNGVTPLGGRIADSLGLPPEPLSSGTVKTGSPDLQESVANYHELRDALSGSRFEWMLTHQ